MKRLRTPFAVACMVIAAAPFAFVAGAPTAFAATTPQILTTKSNKVPACVTPGRLMRMLEKRNTALLPKLRGIATIYKKHGEALRLRWDYAFYQMLVETNYLKFYAPGGKPGDVSPGQNNFAGLGATGKRAPGESFASVDAGVLAHLHHVRLYSGDPVENPVAERTKLVTDLILPWAQSLKRPVTFTDLTRRWAPVGHRYSDAIEGTAENFRKNFCNSAEPDETAADQVVDPTAEVVAEAAPAVVAPAAKPKAKAKVVLIQPPVIEAPAAEPVVAETAAEAPAADVPAADMAAVETPAADGEVTLSGPALKKVAKAATPAKQVVAVEEPAQVIATAEEPAAPAEPAKVVAQAARKAPAKVVKVAVAEAAAPEKLAVDATVTAPSVEADLAAATAKLDGLDTAASEAVPEAPPVATADAASDVASSNEGDGGASEVTLEEATAAKAAAEKPTATVVAVADAADAPVVKGHAAKAKVAAKVVQAAAEDTSDAVATAESPAEDAAGNTHLASMKVPANPASSKPCKVFSASYGGGLAMLIQSPDGDRIKYTALTVNEAKADAQAKAFINVYAKGGQKIAQFGTQNEALTKAFELCPEG